MTVNENRYYVYLHMVKEPFILNDKSYEIGDVAYVGSGQRSRFIVKDKSRSKDHLAVWDKLDKIKIKTGLSENEKHLIERDYIAKYSESGKLLNKRKEHNFTQEIHYEVMKFFFRIDEVSPSKVSWNNHYNNSEVTNLNSSSNYYNVCLAGRTYQISRIAWCLYNKRDCPTDKIVDHVNGDRSDNSATNLRLATYSENVANRKEYSNAGVTVKTVNDIDYIYIKLVRNSKRYYNVINIAKAFPNDTYYAALDKAMLAGTKFREILAERLASGEDISLSSKQELLDSIITGI